MESSFLKHGVVFPERVMEASPFWEYNFHTISLMTKLKINNQKTEFNKRHTNFRLNTLREFLLGTFCG